MDIIILAGGYATRLQPISEFIPKPLLPIQGIPLIEFILETIKVLEPNRILLSINKKFENNFKYWLKTTTSPLKDKIEFVVDPSTDEKNKLGAIRGMYYTIQQSKIDNDFMIIAGDNFFDFDLRKIFESYKKRNIPCIAIYNIKDLNEAKRFGVVKLDKNNFIIEFKEKPDNPTSTLISTGIFVFPKSIISYLEKYLIETNKYDNLGYFIQWLLDKTKIYGEIYEGTWLDIGTLDSYKKVNEIVKKLKIYEQFL